MLIKVRSIIDWLNSIFYYIITPIGIATHSPPVAVILRSSSAKIFGLASAFLTAGFFTFEIFDFVASYYRPYKQDSTSTKRGLVLG